MPSPSSTTTTNSTTRTLGFVLAITFLAATTTSAFSPSFGTPSYSTTTTTKTQLFADQQPQYGNGLEMPDTYVRCGKCQTIYALTEDDLGERGKGRRLECSVCSHSWFQSKDRIMTMKDGFEMIARPEYEIERIHLNMRENKAPNFLGEQKLYVGNIAFECEEQDIYDAFQTCGSVGEVSLVRDDFGKNRGFGFVTMRTSAEGDKAIAELDGAEIKGRNIAVRPSNN